MECTVEGSSEPPRRGGGKPRNDRYRVWLTVQRTFFSMLAAATLSIIDDAGIYIRTPPPSSLFHASSPATPRDGRVIGSTRTRWKRGFFLRGTSVPVGLHACASHVRGVLNSSLGSPCILSIFLLRRGGYRFQRRVSVDRSPNSREKFLNRPTVRTRSDTVVRSRVFWELHSTRSRRSASRYPAPTAITVSCSLLEKPCDRGRSQWNRAVVFDPGSC